MSHRVLIATTAAAWLVLSATFAWPSEKPAIEGAPLDTSISEIRKDASRYYGKLVRIRSTFDEYHHICEGAPPFPDRGHMNKTCMIVSFVTTEIIEPRSSDDFFRVSRMRREAAWLAGRFASFATVTLEARYATPPSPTIDGDFICIDCSELKDARVVRVHVRRPATAPRITQHLRQYPDLALTPADKENARALKATFRAASSAFVSDEENGPVFVFLVPAVTASAYDDLGIEATGGACICKQNDCEGIQWPEYLDQTGDIPANPYKCWRAEKVNGVWKFPLQ